MNNASLPAEVDFLFDTGTIRHRCEIIKQLAIDNKLKYWQLCEDKLPSTANYVLDVIKQNYPDLNVPYHSRWRHIDCSNRSRVHNLAQQIEGDKKDKARALFEMTLVSVLLDAGAGMLWRYNEKDTNNEYSKSEGLAVAAYHQYCHGGFSHLTNTPFLVSAIGLQRTTEEDLERAFQVNDANPLVGVNGRVQLLQSLGNTISTRGPGFTQGQQLAELFDCIANQAQDNRIQAKVILKQLLVSLGPIWPKRLTLDSYNLGDTWDHYALKNETKLPGKIPFHKLSQWLTYSLLEVFEFAGFTITDLDDLTGLPEYRNGGLLIDTGVLHVKNPQHMQQTWQACDEFLVEWRALTVALLDDIAGLIRKSLNMSTEQLPLAKILQGGTWLAGRNLAKEKRSDGGPPFSIQSDGTVF